MATTMTSKGQVTIPKALREMLGLRAGSKIRFRRTPEGRVEMEPVETSLAHDSPLAALRGHAGAGLSTDEIMALSRGEAG